MVNETKTKRVPVWIDYSRGSPIPFTRWLCFPHCIGSPIIEENWEGGGGWDGIATKEFSPPRLHVFSMAWKYLVCNRDGLLVVSPPLFGGILASKTLGEMGKFYYQSLDCRNQNSCTSFWDYFDLNHQINRKESYSKYARDNFFTRVLTYLLPGACINSLEHLKDFCWIRFS